jgi:hypothetical protein
MNNVWITGKISKKELMEHHPLEYEEILRERGEKRETDRIKTLLKNVRRGAQTDNLQRRNGDEANHGK